MGPFPEAPGRVKFLVVTIDYFTKLSLMMVSENGTRFANKNLQEWLVELQIKHVFTSVTHPKGNNQVERANRTILEGIKSRLGRKRVRWVDELPHVLWAYKIIKRRSHDETSFILTYGTEAMTPVEIKLSSMRVLLVEEDNDTELHLNLDLLEERRELAAIKEEKYNR
ncbi:uncharacterized protein LOC143583087 [Bidens hawaiensis]|uniref:uncharacterized protein LOC143583087 n=1 Tax=Bidens hawaiensis TaxID=980011 RepID=UPI004049AA4C